MANSKSKKVNVKVLALSITVLILLVLSIILLNRLLETKSGPEAIEFVPRFISFENSTLTTAYMPAVDSEDNGVLTFLTVEATPGTGRILVDIDNLLFWSDTQQSIRTARNVAENITGKNLDKYDLVYNIYANASLIGGPSAGAAIAVATIAALENKKLNESVIITGSLNHDGSIGPVGNVMEKARAAKIFNASLFLVPLLQSRDVTYEVTKNCEKFGWTEVCSVEQIPKKVNIGKEIGINVVEVENIQEALKYMLEK